jgi:hypothetical protein
LHAAAARAMLRGVKSLTAPVLRAPADRPAWRRGIRAPLAFVAVLGMLWATLNFRQFPETIFGAPRPTIHFHLEGPGWAHPAFYVAFGALGVAAALLWLARRPLGLALGLVLLAGGLGAVIGAVVARHYSGRVTGDRLFALPMGTSRDVVDRQLGWPAGQGSVRLRGDKLDCLVYVNTTARWEGRRHVGLCFRDGRLVYRRAG